eukprot:31807-Prymnesium_polylepis.1
MVDAVATASEEAPSAADVEALEAASMLPSTARSKSNGQGEQQAVRQEPREAEEYTTRMLPGEKAAADAAVESAAAEKAAEQMAEKAA